MSGVKCGICLAFSSSAEKDSFVNTLCGHVFHDTCIRKWIKDSFKPPTCPVCRGNIHLRSLVKLHGISPIELGSEKNKISLKTILLGDSGTGKTSLVNSFAKSSFSENESTVGCDLCFKTLHVAGRFVKLSVWDCGGQDRFKAITPSYLRNVQGVCIIYDVTNTASLQNIKQWLKFVYDYAPKNVSIMLVGNKTDLNKSRQVEKKHGLKIAKEMGFEYIETSAKDLTNVEAAFRTLVASILERLWNEGIMESLEIEAPESKPLRIGYNGLQHHPRSRSGCAC